MQCILWFHMQLHLPLQVPTLAGGGGTSESQAWEAWSGQLNPSQAVLGQAALPPRGLKVEVSRPSTFVGLE